MSNSTESHLEQLKKKHRALDDEILDLSKSPGISSVEIRRLKTQKLWLKDEIHRVETQIEGATNGH